MRSATVLLTLFLTGTVHAAPLAQAQTVPINLPDWLAGASIGAVALYLIMRIIASINAGKAPAGAHDALVRLADNQAEAIKLDRERFEAQKVDDKERNKNIADLMTMYKEDHERMKANEATMTRQVDEITRADLKLAESVQAMNVEDARHNKEIEARLSEIERSMTEVRADLAAVKASVGPNTAEKLGTVEDAFGRLTVEFHALVKALEEKPVEAITETKHENITTVTVTGPAGAADPHAIASAGRDANGAGLADNAHGGAGGAGNSHADQLDGADADPLAKPTGAGDGGSAG